MEKRSKIESGEGEFQLPETIIQHIQSFLSGKQAAQTTILSKSWYSAWSTRPNLDFDQRDFQNPRISGGFSEFVKKTMQRYEDSNLKIESFRLCMESAQRNSRSLANELIAKAMKMGATDLGFEHLSQFNFGYLSLTANFVLPPEVLGCETLTGLSATGCKIDRGMDGKVGFSRLTSLRLCRVFIEHDTIWDIISSCPLVEKLLLSELFSVRSFDVVSPMNRMLELSPFTEFGQQNVGSVVDRPMILYEFRKLKSLLLKMVNIDTMFFHDFSSKFPCLKELSLDCCDWHETMRISSTSLERISLAHHKMFWAAFDVPSIRKLSFSGSKTMPSLSFGRASREWESDVSINCGGYRLTTSWFLELKMFLEKLSMSKVSLSLKIGSLQENDGYAGEIRGLCKPRVENLMLSFYEPCAALLNGLFSTCRPKFMTLYCWDKSCIGLAGKAISDLLELLYKNCSSPNRNIFDLHDLEEVNVEIFEENLAEWRRLPWKTLLDASTSPEDGRKIRLQLRWGLETLTF